MSREIPFDPDAICDECEAKGAYDFCGDNICPECAKKHFRETIERVKKSLDEHAEVWQAMAKGE